MSTDALQLGFVLFPNLTQLDLAGPLQVLHRLPGATTHLVARTLAPVPSDCGLSLLPTQTFETCPPLDVLVIPGGFGVEAALRDEATVAFVRRQGQTARWVTSVCTGAFLLGAAGLLEGRRATTHWAYRGLLPLVGATPVHARVVHDGHVVTGGGVTAGIDFALELARDVAGVEVAQRIQLGLEYDPAPPFDAGSPERAPAAVRATLEQRYAPRLATFSEALRTRSGG
jgi:cyclohexyl-isocyanide hydratase